MINTQEHLDGAGKTVISINDDFVGKLFNKHRATVGRAISIIEQGDDIAQTLLNKIHANTGNAYRIGITGPPGAGKSTLLAGLIRYMHTLGHSIGVIAIDPSSPFTQGAVLGDRVRMVDIDNDVFIRSMASRGHAGGLSARTCDAMDILDAAGFDFIFLESVGVGQVELEIEKFTDTTIVILVPESGDQVQAIKAGLMEIANIYVLNKYDRPDSHAALNTLQTALNFRTSHKMDWSPVVLPAVATDGEGMLEIFNEIMRHHDYLIDHDILGKHRMHGLRSRIIGLVNEYLCRSFSDSTDEKYLEKSMQSVANGNLSPQQLAKNIAVEFLGRDKINS